MFILGKVFLRFCVSGMLNKAIFKPKGFFCPVLIILRLGDKRGTNALISYGLLSRYNYYISFFLRS